MLMLCQYSSVQVYGFTGVYVLYKEELKYVNEFH